MSLSKNLSHFNCQVVACGCLYGNGDDILYEYFKKAWLQEDTLKVIGHGLNNVPSIHVRDVAKLVKRLLTTK